MKSLSESVWDINFKIGLVTTVYDTRRFDTNIIYGGSKRFISSMKQPLEDKLMEEFNVVTI